MKKELSYKDLISILSMYQTHERSISQERATYTSHFLNSIFLVLGGGIAILTAMDDIWYKYLFLLLSGVLASTLSVIMFKINKRTYRVQLEAIAKCGKLEDLLSFTDAELYGGNEFWQNEGLALPRHFKDMKGTQNKTEFVNNYLGKGQLKLLLTLSILLFIFSSFFSIYGLVELIYKLFF